MKPIMSTIVNPAHRKNLQTRLKVLEAEMVIRQRSSNQSLRGIERTQRMIADLKRRLEQHA